MLRDNEKFHATKLHGNMQHCCIVHSELNYVYNSWIQSSYTHFGYGIINLKIM